MSMTLPREVLMDYPNKVFIETGTNIGDGVALALSLGFEHIYSIEKNDIFYEVAKYRFRDKDNVYLFHGDSGIILPKILRQCNGSCTLWLDAHIDPNDPKGMNPLYDELFVIGESKYSEKYTIMIDDIPQMGTKSKLWFGDNWSALNEEQVYTFLRVINPVGLIERRNNMFTKDAIIVLRP